MNIADLVVADREIALPARIAGIGLRQAPSNGEIVGIGFQRGFQVTVLLPDVAKADARPILVVCLITRLGQFKHTLKPRLRFIKIAVIDLNPARPK